MGCRHPFKRNSCRMLHPDRTSNTSQGIMVAVLKAAIIDGISTILFLHFRRCGVVSSFHRPPRAEARDVPNRQPKTRKEMAEMACGYSRGRQHDVFAALHQPALSQELPATQDTIWRPISNGHTRASLPFWTSGETGCCRYRRLFSVHPTERQAILPRVAAARRLRSRSQPLLIFLICDVSSRVS